jgi:hypothetical protein
MVAGLIYFRLEVAFSWVNMVSEWSTYKHRSHTKGPLYNAFSLLLKFYSSNNGKSYEDVVAGEISKPCANIVTTLTEE